VFKKKPNTSHNCLKKALFSSDCFKIHITWSLGYKEYIVKKLSDLVTPALNDGPASLGDRTHQPTQECLVSIDLPPHSGDLSLQLTDVVTLLLGNPLLYYAPNILNRPDIWKLWALKSVLIRNPRGWFDLAQPNFFSIHSANTTLLALWSSVSFCVLYLW